MVKFLILILLIALIDAAPIPSCGQQSECLSATLEIVNASECTYKICLSYDGGCSCSPDGSGGFDCNCACDKCEGCYCDTAGNVINATCPGPSHSCCGTGGEKEIISCADGESQETFCCNNECGPVPECCDPETDPDGEDCFPLEGDDACNPPPDVCSGDDTLDINNCDGTICCQTVTAGDSVWWGFKDGTDKDPADDCCGSDGSECSSYDLNGALFECFGAEFPPANSGKNRICGSNQFATDQNECGWRFIAPTCGCEDDEKICPDQCEFLGQAFLSPVEREVMNGGNGANYVRNAGLVQGIVRSGADDRSNGDKSKHDGGDYHKTKHYRDNDKNGGKYKKRGNYNDGNDQTRIYRGNGKNRAGVWNGNKKKDRHY